MGIHIVDLNSFPDIPYRNADILQVAKVGEGQPLTNGLEGILDLTEGRPYLFHVRLKDVKYGKKLKKGIELLVKPYVSKYEPEVAARLVGSEMSPILGVNGEYFVEERIRIPSIDSALAAKATFLDEVAGLFGKALYLMHSRGISYNGRFNNHVFADDITKKVKVSNFSRARITSEAAALSVDIIEALSYMEALAQNYKVEDSHFFDAMRKFKSDYAVDDKSRITWDVATNHFLYIVGSPLMISALKMFLPSPPPARYPNNGKVSRPVKW